MRYQSDSQQATCRSITEDKDLELHWLHRLSESFSPVWSVKTVDSFDLKPYCKAISKSDSFTCLKPLDIVVYSKVLLHFNNLFFRLSL